MISLPVTGGSVSIDKLQKATKALLQAGEKGLTKKDLAKAMEASEKRAQEAISLLMGQDAVIDRVTHPGERTIRFILRNPPDWMIHVTRDLQFSAGLAASLMRTLCGAALAAPLETLHNDALGTMTPRERKDYDFLMARTELMDGINFGKAMPPPEEPLRFIQQAILDLFSQDYLHLVQIQYLDPFTGDSSDLLISPWKLLLDHRAKAMFLLGLDTNREVPILLALSCIKDLKVSKDMAGAFPQPPGEMEEVLDAAIHGTLSLNGLVPNDENLVRLGWCSNEAQHLLTNAFRNRPGFRQRGGSIEFAALDLEEIVRWAITNGTSEIQLLHPPELVDRFGAHLHRLRAMLR